jgi:DNA-binding MarR family transcriptional regulator
LPPSAKADLIGGILDDFDELVRQGAMRDLPRFLAIDVTMSQAKVMHMLAVAGRTGMSSLAVALGVTLPTMSGLVDRLVEHGLVTRTEGQDDRRHVLVGLTQRGVEVMNAFQEVGRCYLRGLLVELDHADLDHLRIGLRALLTASSRGRAAAAPPRAGA